VSLVAKRLFDLALASIMILLLSPVIAILAMLVRWKLGSPILFRQARPGINARIFFLLKFRTMTEDCDEKGKLLDDQYRLTPFGKWLRSSSLDELPQLWNVIRGDLSFVGPRPLLVQYLSRYSKEQARRHAVKPGITGWAQINGRNALTWEEKFALDTWYVEHWSLLLDARILCLTTWKVLTREGVSSLDHATMPEFKGTSVGSTGVALRVDRRQS
jgi:sugar transferase EpsL